MKARTALILFLLLLVAGLGAWAGWYIGNPGPPPPPEIRTEIREVMVPVEVVKEIEVEVPGPERVVEKVVWRTRDVEVPGETIEIIRQIPTTEPITGRVIIDAVKYEGTVEGKLERGWLGEANCQVRSKSTDWATIVRQPFDKTLSFTQSTDKPGTLEERLAKWRLETRVGLTTAPGVEAGFTYYKRGRFGWWANVRFDMDPTLEFIPQSETYRSLDKWELAAGVAFSWGRR